MSHLEVQAAGCEPLGGGAPLAVVELGEVHEVHVDVEVPNPLLL